MIFNAAQDKDEIPTIDAGEDNSGGYVVMAEFNDGMSFFFEGIDRREYAGDIAEFFDGVFELAQDDYD